MSNTGLESAIYVSSAKQSLLIASSVVIIVALQVALFFAMQRFHERKPDFAALYQAGRRTLHERFPALIDHFPAMNSEAYTVTTPNGDYPYDTLHPPYELALYSVLALLKFHVAYPLWWACNTGLVLLSAFLLWRYVPNLRGSYPYLLILIATFFPVLVALVQGQNSVLLLALLTLSYCSLESQQEFRAGVFLSMGMFKFVLVIPIALWLVLERRWKGLAGFFTGCCGLLFVAVWLVGVNGIQAYIRLAAGYGRKTPEEPGTESIMPNLRGMFHAIGTGIAPEKFLIAFTLICSAAVLLWVDARLSNHRELGMRFSTQVLVAILISYHLYPHDAAILVLPLMILLDRSRSYAIERQFKTVVLVCIACTYLFPFTGLRTGMPVVGLCSLVLLIIARYEESKSPLAQVC
jgi:hypothetical protein